MARKTDTRTEPDFTQLVEGIIEDGQRLIRQEFELLRGEVREEIAHAKSAAVSAGAGVGLLALGGALGVEMLVHGLHAGTGLPLWACYGLVGGAAGAAGVALLGQARRQAAGVHLGLPPQTAASLSENLAWLKGQPVQG